MRSGEALRRLLAPYQYRYPPELVANRPSRPRDAARLLAFDRKTGRIALGAFRDLAHFLPARAVFVFNETKVIPARLTLARATGGRVRVLYLGREKNAIRALAERTLRTGEALRWGKRIFLVMERRGREYVLRPLFPLAAFNLLLERQGDAPIPPYIKETPLTRRELRREYQSVFARRPGSIAAPTASLHFTTLLLARLRRSGFGIEFITLHVNIGTFLPLDENALRTGRLHAEEYSIAPAAMRRLNRAHQEGRPVIAVGTTVVRVLESAANARGVLGRRQGITDLFIRPGYCFRFVSGIITNFHVPGSSLMMLVAAFVGRVRLLRIYRRAIRRRMRLFSFGDGMIVT